jgi:hypothetical protein
VTVGINAVYQRRDRNRNVRPLNVYLLRLVYFLMFFLLGRAAWTHVLPHQGPWEPDGGVVWSAWAAYASPAGLGVIRPLTMLPILPLEKVYEVLWLVIVAFPLWNIDRFGRVVGVEYDRRVLVGHPADRRRSLGIRVREGRVPAPTLIQAAVPTTDATRVRSFHLATSTPLISSHRQ